MGIIKFNNVPSTTPGLEVETFPNYVAPEKEYQVTHVPGRNGDLVVDTKTYKNVPRSYKVSMAVEPPAVSVSGSTASFEATAERALAECKTVISSDVGKVGTTIINSATDPVENNEPYNFRAVPNGVGDRENDTLIGGTVAWNQLSPANLKGDTLSPTGSETYIGKAITPLRATKTNHIYYVSIDVTSYGGTRTLRAYTIAGTNNYGRPTLDLTENNRHFAWLLKGANDNSTCSIGFSTNGQGNLTTDEVITYDNAMFIDLTVMFGSTIADYLWSQMSGTSGAGADYFRNLFPKSYYAYNEGELISVKTEAHKTTGKNFLEPTLLASSTVNGITFTALSDGTIRANGTATDSAILMINNITGGGNLLDNLLPLNNVACIGSGCPSVSGCRIAFARMDGSSFYDDMGSGVSFTVGNLTPSTNAYVRLQVLSGYTVNNVIFKPMIRLASVVDDTYEPYEEHIYPLNPALELRGIPKLNSSNKLYYDGDIYSSDGSVIRKYGVIDLGSLTWGYNNTNFYSEVVNDKAYGHDIVCEKYSVNIVGSISDAPDKTIRGNINNGRIFVKDSSYTDATAFKTAMSGVYLIYELATPVIESTSGLIDNVSIASFDDGADNEPVNLLKSEIVAVQNLHGYEKPWFGGAGKNKIPLVLADIKTANTSGTWSGNTYTINSATFTVNIDNDGNVISIIGNGNGSSSNYISLPFTLKSGSYILTSDFTESLGSYDTFLLNGSTTIARGNSTNPGQSFTLNSNSSVEWRFRVLNNSNYTCKPMIRLSTETSATFEPYSNICSISGFDSAVVRVNRHSRVVETLTSEYVSASGIVTQSPANPYKCVIARVNQGEQYTYSVNGVATTISSMAYFDKYPLLGTQSYNSSRLLEQNATFTSPVTGYVFIRGNMNYDEVNQMVAIGTSTEYEQGNKYTFTFGQTVYGGQFDNKSGETVTHGFVDLANYAGTINKAGSGDSTYFRFDDVLPYPKYNGSMLCNKFPQVSITTSTTNVGVSIVKPSSLDHPAIAFRPENPSTYTTTTILDYIQSLGSLAIFYELATPKATTEGEGNLVVTHRSLKIKDLNWTLASTGSIVRFYSNVVADILPPATASSPMTDIYSECYQKAETFNNVLSNNCKIAIYTNKAINITDDAYSTASDFKTARGECLIICPLANPITLAITSQDIPTLLGENNIFANTGNIKALSYPKQVCPFEPAQEVDDNGTEEYIDNREVAIPVGHESKYFTAGKIYNFSWLDKAGLIKEGELNADTGVLTITNGYGIVDLGDLTWTLSNSTAEYFSTPKSAINEGMIALSCSVYKVYTTDPSLDKSLFQTSNSIRIRDSSFFRSVSSSVVDPTFKSAMHGVKLLYELADPVRTIQLTPVQVESLIGHNVLVSESGNISVTPRTYSTYTEKMNAISDWLHSASGYARLEDTYEPDYYRKAYYDEQTDMENIFDEAGRATLKFVCKPQRYLKSGEEPITISSGGLIQNRTRYEAYPILKVTTNNTQGSVAIGNHSITIKAGAGTDTIIIDCELQDAWSGTSNKNSYIVLTDGEFPVIDPGTQTVTFDGGVQSVEVIPRWWTV